MSPRLSDLFLRSQSDERLVELVRTGHDRAFTTIVERYRRPLYLFARRLNSGGSAEDVVQQAFLGAFSALRAGAEVRHLRGWLHQIVRNAAVSTAAHAPREAVSSTLVGAVGADDRGDAHLVAVSALEEVSRLPERQRDALVATLQGRSRSDVARSMGLSEGAVRQLVHRARATVRQGLTALTPYPLAQWLSAGGAPTADRVCELASGAGAAGMAGIALKLSAVAASGVIAAAIATSHHAAPRSAPPPRVVASVAQTETAVPLRRLVAAAAVPARPVAPAVPDVPDVPRPRTAPVLERRRGRARSGERDGDGERRARAPSTVVVVTRHDGRGDGGSGQGRRDGHRGGDASGRGGGDGHGGGGSSDGGSGGGQMGDD